MVLMRRVEHRARRRMRQDFSCGKTRSLDRLESVVVVIELLVVLGLLAVVVLVRGAECGVGALVRVVREDEDLPVG